MQKWEYCLLWQRKGKETWLNWSSGEREKVKGDEANLLNLLGRLGAEGWEAVNFNPGNSVDMMMRASFGTKDADWPQYGNREILFKRPLAD